jgi:toxin ParE1/3/4
MAQVAWTSEAHRWLRDIYDYIAADNPAAAERVALAIYDSVRVLREHPRLGVFHGALPIERYLI